MFDRVGHVEGGFCTKSIVFDRVGHVEGGFCTKSIVFDRVEQQVDNYFADSEQAKLVSTMEQQLRENEYLIDFSKLEGEFSLADRMGKGILDLRTVSSMSGTAV